MNLAPLFPVQFLDQNGDPYAGGKLYTYESGTTTPQTTYSDEAGTPNTNPIILDSAGRCDLWLDPALTYTLTLKDSADVLVKTWDNVDGVVSGSVGVTSVNTLTGDVVLAAEDIGFTTGTAATWFSGDDVAEALDSLINKIDLPGDLVTASQVPITDAGDYYTGTNVEAALQEVGARVVANTLPDQTGNSGKYLTTNGTAASWGTYTPAAFTASIPAGDLTVSVASGGPHAYGSRSVAVVGGTVPHTYFWVPVAESGSGLVTSGLRTASITLSGSGDGGTNLASVLCVVTDATGRVTTAAFNLSATHAASGA